MARCSNCGHSFTEADDRCIKCGADVGFPNVRAAAAEASALDKRYQTAIDLARKQGTHDPLKDFEAHMQRTFAVINVKLGFLYSFVSDNKMLYANYHRAVSSQARKTAEPENDRHRTGVDSRIFGSYSDRIIHAALSLDGRGPSYGTYSMRLEDIAIKNRASLLEENSYNFVERQNLKKGRIPPGYRAIWQERHKLAVAKLAASVSSTTIEKEYPYLLLPASSGRSTDEYIEVHIFGTFDNSAIESVRGKSTHRKKADQALVESAKEHLRKADKVWVEG